MAATRSRRCALTLLSIGLGLGLLLYTVSRVSTFLHDLGCGFVYVCSDPIQVVDGRAMATMARVTFAFEPRYVGAAGRAWNNPKEFSAFWLQLPLDADGSLMQGPVSSEAPPPHVIRVLLTTYSMDEGALMGVKLRDWRGRETAPVGSLYHESDVTELSSVYLRERLSDLQMEALVLQNPNDKNPLEEEYFLEVSSGRVTAAISCTRVQPPNSDFKSGCMRTNIIFGSIWYKIIFDRALLPKWREIDAGVQDFLRASLAAANEES